MKEEKEVVIKRKIWVERKGQLTGNIWALQKAQGFKPDVESWTDQELEVFLKENNDIEPVLTY